jgi:hypothetical protein
LEQREYLNLIRTATKNCYKNLGAGAAASVERAESDTSSIIKERYAEKRDLRVTNLVRIPNTNQFNLRKASVPSTSMKESSGKLELSKSNLMNLERQRINSRDLETRSHIEA